METNLTLPPIPLDANKYSRGSLLILAGSRRYFGAGVLATRAAEKTGAGYVTLGTPVSAAPAARQHLLCSPVKEAHEVSTTGSFQAEALSSLLSDLRQVQAICCGPGLTVTPDTILFVESVLRYSEECNIPLLLDADALNCLSAKPEMLRSRATQSPLILTPHAGELARLSKAMEKTESPGAPAGKKKFSSHEQILFAARSLSEQLDAILVAKGPATCLVGSGLSLRCEEGTPALARAGTGDVLSGIISSLLAQGLPLDEAAVLGVRIHSLAGNLAEEAVGRRSVTALEVIDALPQAVRAFERA